MTSSTQQSIVNDIGLIEVRKVSADFNSIDDYNVFKYSLLCTSIHPGLAHSLPSQQIPDAIWALTLKHQSKNTIKTSLIAFAEIDFNRHQLSSSAYYEMSSLDEWVTHFAPESIGDWLMVPILFLTYLRTGCDLPALTAISDPWLDSLLRESRGRLVWSHQFIEMIQVIAKIDISEATRIYSMCSTTPHEHQKILDEIYYQATNQTLLEIYSERSAGIEHLDSPDYFLADCLATHYNHSRQMITSDRDQVNKQVLDINQKTNTSSYDAFFSIKDLVVEVADKIDNAHSKESRSHITDIPTGFADIDSITSGLQRGEVIVLAGRPSMGKTTFALNVAQNIAIEKNLPVAIFSMKLSSNQLALEMTSSLAQINKHKMLSGEIEDTEWSNLARAFGKLAEAPIFIDDRCGLSCMDISLQLRKLEAQCGDLGLIIIDRLQLMTTMKGQLVNDSINSDAIISSLKVLAKQLDCPIIVISNVNNELESRTDKRPILNDLPTPNFADVVLFIYRDEVYDSNSLNKGMAEIIIARHRNGPLGRVRLNYKCQLALFEDYQ